MPVFAPPEYVWNRVRRDILVDSTFFIWPASKWTRSLLLRRGIPPCQIIQQSLQSIANIMNKYNFDEFERSLRVRRRLCEYWGYGLVGFANRDEFCSLTGMPTNEKVDEDINIIESSSLFKPPTGEPLLALEWAIGQALPLEFAAFHALFSEAIVVTRTQPIHLFSMEKIIEEISGNTVTAKNRMPRRFFRFGGSYVSTKEHYGLRQAAPGSTEWEVVPAANQPDEFLEGASDFGEYYYWKDEPVPKAIAPSFQAWLAHLIKSDGMDDPYLEPHSPGGAWYDPV